MATATLTPAPSSIAIARRQHARDRLLQAAIAYRDVLQSEPDSPAALLGLSSIARQTQQFQLALQVAQSALLSRRVQSDPEQANLVHAHIGHCLFAQQKIPEAEFAYERVLNQPDSSVRTPLRSEAQLQAHMGLGELLIATNRPASAIPHFLAVIRLVRSVSNYQDLAAGSASPGPTLVAALFGLGNANAAAQDFRAALEAFEQAVQLAPGSPECHFALGFTFARLTQLHPAIAAYRRAIQLRPRFAAAWLNLGVTLIADGRDQLAVPCYLQAIAVLSQQDSIPRSNDCSHQTRISAHLNLGHLYRNRRHFLQAQRQYRHALSLIASPQFHQGPDRKAEVYIAFTYLHLEKGDFAEAWESLRQAEPVDYEGANPEVPNARGILLLAEHSLHQERRTSEDSSLSTSHLQPAKTSSNDQILIEALSAFEQAQALGHKTAASNRGNTLLRLGRCHEALVAHQDALDPSKGGDAHHPGARYNLALTQLRLGDFANGWRNYEIRWSFRDVHPHPRHFLELRWQGESSSASAPISLFIYGEQGLGDTIQFLRYLPLAADRLTGQCAVAETTSKLILEVQSPLTRLLTPHIQQVQASFPNLSIYLIAYGDAIPPFTHHCPLLSLPALFETTLATVPPPANVLLSNLFQPDGALHVGLAWAGNPNYRADRERSTQLSTFLPIFTLPGLEFISLQKGEAARQIAKLALVQANRGLAFNLEDASSQDRDLADTAATIARCDLVISTDTVVAHLAGSLGKPLWLLLPWQSDWRWMQEISTSPWYPTARLFRQSSENNWPELMERVAQQLLKLRASKSPSPVKVNE